MHKKCKICGKPIVLVPSAAERAKKFGGKASDYIALFETHSDCQLTKNKKDLKDLLMRRSGSNPHRKKTEYVIRLKNGRFGIRDATGTYTHVFDDLARAKIVLSILQRGGKVGKIVRAKRDRYNPRRKSRNYKKYAKHRSIRRRKSSRRKR